MTATLGYVSNQQIDAWIAELVVPKSAHSVATSWCSLHSTNPGVVSDNPANTEIGGPTYQRAEVYWKAGTRLLTSINAQDWQALPLITVITHLGIFSEQTRGFIRAVIPLVNPVTMHGNGSYHLDPGSLYLRWP